MELLNIEMLCVGNRIQCAILSMLIAMCFNVFYLIVVAIEALQVISNVMIVDGKVARLLGWVSNLFVCLFVCSLVYRSLSLCVYKSR